MAGIIKITFLHSDGTMYYVDDAEQVAQIIRNFPKVIRFKKTTDMQTLRHKYFAMVDELHKNANTGYTKTTLHEALKPLVLTKLLEFKHYFSNNTPEVSTVHLNVEGFKEAIDNLKDVANSVFAYVFKNEQ